MHSSLLVIRQAILGVFSNKVTLTAHGPLRLYKYKVETQQGPKSHVVCDIMSQ